MFLTITIYKICKKMYYMFEVVMKFKVISEDEMYVEALKKYYEKHYKERLSMYFGDEDVDAIIICDDSLRHLYEQEHTLVFSDQNQVMTHQIMKYQSGKDFIEFIESIHETDLSGHSPFRTYGFVNGVSCSGATVISLNLAEYLSQKGRTLWFSLEEVPSTQYYLERKSGLSMTDVLFYLIHDPEKLKSRLHEWSNDSFLFLDQVENIHDLSQMTIELLNVLMVILEDVGFSNIVIDFGNRTEWIDKIQMYKKNICLLQSLNHFYRFQFNYKHKNLDVYQVVINRACNNIKAHESVLKMVNHLNYLEEDKEITGKKWQSKMLQHTLVKHLNLK